MRGKVTGDEDERALLSRVIEETLFEVRPYIEDNERLREFILGLKASSRDLEHLKGKIEEKIRGSGEPFKTDLRIFLQKLESVERESR